MVRRDKKAFFAGFLSLFYVFLFDFFYSRSFFSFVTLSLPVLLLYAFPPSSSSLAAAARHHQGFSTSIKMLQCATTHHPGFFNVLKGCL
ncbi:hypothetical protein BGZ63DRAFT_383603 [Mariannaea sp. PMI_226]|nr:hypothetical protein BGZ63DRAFT_383603 [Mariannaea sp. PMI_226]